MLIRIYHRSWIGTNKRFIKLGATSDSRSEWRIVSTAFSPMIISWLDRFDVFIN